MKSYNDKLERMGVIFLKEQAINLVLLSLPKSYGQFLENFHMRNLDVTLINMTQMLIVVEAEILKNITKAETLKRSDPKVSMDVDNDNIGDLGNISLPSRK